MAGDAAFTQIVHRRINEQVFTLQDKIPEFHRARDCQWSCADIWMLYPEVVRQAEFAANTRMKGCKVPALADPTEALRCNKREVNAKDKECGIQP